MPFITTDQTSTQSLANLQSLTVIQGVNVVVDPGAGITNAVAATNTDINVFGGVYAQTFGVHWDNSGAYGGHVLYVGPTGIVYGDTYSVLFDGTTNAILNDGTISSDGNSIFGTGGLDFQNSGNVNSSGVFALYLGSFDEEVNFYTVSNTGTISSRVEAIHVRDASGIIVNSGTIAGLDRGIAFSNFDARDADTTLEITNSGTISGSALAIQGVSATPPSGYTATLEVTNSGTISSLGYAIDAKESLALVTNSGTINGDVDLGERIAQLDNSGEINGDVTFDSGADVQAINTGQINGDFRGYTITATMTLTNVGLITGDVLMPDSFSVFDGNGGEVLGQISTGSGGGWVISGIGDDSVLGGDAIDNLSGAQGDDDIYGGGGGDTLKGGDGEDTLSGDAGDDLLRGHDGNDSLDGGDDDDLIEAHQGDDTLIGGTGFDTLYGHGGNDVLDAGSRNDWLIGGRGDDTMTGGGGGDRFIIRRVGNGDDEVTDFQNGSDRVDISVLGVQNFNALNNTFNALSQTTDGVVIDLEAAGGSGSILLIGVSLSDMDGSDFIF